MSYVAEVPVVHRIRPGIPSTRYGYGDTAAEAISDLAAELAAHHEQAVGKMAVKQERRP